jgi:hypothetical protein
MMDITKGSEVTVKQVEIEPKIVREIPRDLPDLIHSTPLKAKPKHKRQHADGRIMSGYQSITDNHE